MAEKVGKGGSGGQELRSMGPGLALLGGDQAFPIARVLRRAGLAVLEAEPAPEGTPEALAARYGFGFASVRAGRLGHLAEVRQLVDQALGGDWPHRWLWRQADGTLADGLRPGVDPQGLPDADLATAYRSAHLATLRALLAKAPLLVLAPATTRGLVDPQDRTLYPEPPPGIAPPQELTAQEVPSADLDAAFTALHSALRGVNPGLRIWVLLSAATGPAAATLATLAADWRQRLPGVIADPVLDRLVERLASPDLDDAACQRLGAVIAALLDGADLVDLLAGTLTAEAATTRPAAPALDKAARRERRKAREARRERAKAGAVVCEDELLEAFS